MRRIMVSVCPGVALAQGAWPEGRKPSALRPQDALTAGILPHCLGSECRGSGDEAGRRQSFLHPAWPPGLGPRDAVRLNVLRSRGCNARV